MKKTLTIFVLVTLAFSLLLCGCDKNSQKEDGIVKKTEIRQDANSVTVVYEDGYEHTYWLTQPVEVYVESDNTRSARAVGVSTYYFASTDGTNMIYGEKGDYSASVNNSGDYIISDGTSFVGNASISDVQIQMGTTERYFERDGKKYEDCSSELLTIFRTKTTLIDFATGYEGEPYDNISSFGFEKFENLEAVILPASIKKVGKKAFDSCNKLATVYYLGTETEWQNVELVNTEIKTVDKEDKTETVEVVENALAQCTVYFYSENAPVDAGNYWHFVDGNPVAW